MDLGDTDETWAACQRRRAVVARGCGKSAKNSCFWSMMENEQTGAGDQRVRGVAPVAAA